MSLPDLEVGSVLLPTHLALFDIRVFDIPGMETLTEYFERRIADFLRRTRLTPSEFGERAIGDRKFCGDLRRGRSPTLGTADRVFAFMDSFDRASSSGEGRGSRPELAHGDGGTERRGKRSDGPSANGLEVGR